MIYTTKLKTYLTKKEGLIAGLSLVMLLGLPLLVVVTSRQQNLNSDAASLATLEAENGTLAGSASIITDSNASGGKYVRFAAQPTGTTQPTVTQPIGTGGINYRADLETGNSSQFTALECANPSRQFQIVQSPVRQGRYAARFETTASDVWGNGSVRCLAANYNTNEAEGQEYYYGFSMYFPQKINYNLLWELHHRQPLYKFGALSVAPFAIEANSNGGMTFRIATGKANWNGSSWTGWSYWNPQIPLGAPLDNYPTNTWIDFLVHIKFTESNTGVVEVWHRAGNAPWPATPQISRTNIPTLPWIPGGLDPGVPTTVHADSLYLEMGLYGSPSTNVIYQDGFRRGTSKAAVMAEFP